MNSFLQNSATSMMEHFGSINPLSPHNISQSDDDDNDDIDIEDDEQLYSGEVTHSDHTVTTFDALSMDHGCEIPSLSSLAVPSPIITIKQSKESALNKQNQKAPGYIIKSSNASNDWTQEELQLFGDALASHGESWERFWDVLSNTALAKNRGIAIIREKWCGIMGSRPSSLLSSVQASSSESASINRGPSWNEAEINALKRAVAKHQLKWKHIKGDPEFARFFQGRSENSLKSKWNRVRLDGRKSVGLPINASHSTNVESQNSSSDSFLLLSGDVKTQDLSKSDSLTLHEHEDEVELAVFSNEGYPQGISETSAFRDFNEGASEGSIQSTRTNVKPYSTSKSKLNSSGLLADDFHENKIEPAEKKSKCDSEGSECFKSSLSDPAKFLECRNDPLELIERALLHCVNLQLPMSLVDADCALMQMNSSKGMEGESGVSKNYNLTVTRAWFIKGISHFQQGLYDLAIRDCENALNIDPEFVPAYVLRGLASLNLGVVGGLTSPNFAALSRNAFSDLSKCISSELSNQARINLSLHPNSRNSDKKRKF
jgi:tetratricopeptide (TPR) repeat protein